VKKRKRKASGEKEIILPKTNSMKISEAFKANNHYSK
jgi:hypothetical protein